MPGRKQKASARARADANARRIEKKNASERCSREDNFEPIDSWLPPVNISFVEFQVKAPWIFDQTRWIQVPEGSISSETCQYWRCAKDAGTTFQCTGTTLCASTEFGGLCQMCTTTVKRGESAPH